MAESARRILESFSSRKTEEEVSISKSDFSQEKGRKEDFGDRENDSNAEEAVSEGVNPIRRFFSREVSPNDTSNIDKDSPSEPILDGNGLSPENCNTDFGENNSINPITSINKKEDPERTEGSLRRLFSLRNGSNGPANSSLLGAREEGVRSIITECANDCNEKEDLDLHQSTAIRQKSHDNTDGPLRRFFSRKDNNSNETNDATSTNLGGGDSNDICEESEEDDDVSESSSEVSEVQCDEDTPAILPTGSIPDARTEYSSGCDRNESSGLVYTNRNIGECDKKMIKDKIHGNSGPVVANGENTRNNVQQLVGGVTNFVSNVFQQHKDSQQQHSQGTDDEELNEKVFVLNEDYHPTMQSYRSFSSSAITGKSDTGKVNDQEFYDAEVNRLNKNAPLLERIGSKVNAFFEQHPEVMEFIDGPNGEDNKGFYRHVEVIVDREDSNDSPNAGKGTQLSGNKVDSEKINGDSNLIEDLRREVQVHKARSDKLEQELKKCTDDHIEHVVSLKNIWKKKVQTMQLELDKVREELRILKENGNVSGVTEAEEELLHGKQETEKNLLLDIPVAEENNRLRPTEENLFSEQNDEQHVKLGSAVSLNELVAGKNHLIDFPVVEEKNLLLDIPVENSDRELEGNTLLIQINPVEEQILLDEHTEENLLLDIDVEENNLLLDIPAENANLLLDVPVEEKNSLLDFNDSNPSAPADQQNADSTLNSDVKFEDCGCGLKLPAAVTSALSSDEVTRYSRQLLLADGFGVEGQKKLLNSKVLVVGAGGIGSTVLPYLAAAGVGTISVIDHDTVDRSNLHRQILHSENSIGINKAVSACAALKALNPSVQCVPIETNFSADNGLELATTHDVVVDATDNPQTRYLINDACVLSGTTPLISGSAMGTEGQLSVYNYGGSGCYRCLYPNINPAEGCKSCSDNGVLGPVPGLIGILEAMEVIKVLTGIGTVMHDKLVMYDSLRCSFLNIKKPRVNRSCPVSGAEATIKTMADSRASLEAVRGPSGVPQATVAVKPELPPHLNVSCPRFEEIRKSGAPHLLLDVRPKRQYEICAMEQSVNIPLDELETRMEEVKSLSENWNKNVYVLCRRGVKSVAATRMITEVIANEHAEDRAVVQNIVGGLNSWVKEVDSTIPMY